MRPCVYTNPLTIENRRCSITKLNHDRKRYVHKREYSVSTNHRLFPHHGRAHPYGQVANTASLKDVCFSNFSLQQQHTNKKTVGKRGTNLPHVLTHRKGTTYTSQEGSEFFCESWRAKELVYQCALPKNPAGQMVTPERGGFVSEITEELPMEPAHTWAIQPTQRHTIGIEQIEGRKIFHSRLREKKEKGNAQEKSRRPKGETSPTPKKKGKKGKKPHKTARKTDTHSLSPFSLKTQQPPPFHYPAHLE